MKVYFYHTQNIQYCLRRMAEGEFPSHFLYGACHLADNGVDVVYHRSPKHELSRLKTALYTAWRVLTCRCLLFTSDAADDHTRVERGGRRRRNEQYRSK